MKESSSAPDKTTHSSFSSRSGSGRAICAAPSSLFLPFSDAVDDNLAKKEAWHKHSSALQPPPIALAMARHRLVVPPGRAIMSSASLASVTPSRIMGLRGGSLADLSFFSPEYRWALMKISSRERLWHFAAFFPGNISAMLRHRWASPVGNVFTAAAKSASSSGC